MGHFNYLVIALILLDAPTNCDNPGRVNMDDMKADSTLNYNGFTYHTKIIGTQEWTIENLRTTKFNDGTSIEKISNPNKWKKSTKGAYCAYDSSEVYVSTYGYLYNWHIATSAIIAPATGGWRVPNEDDWNKLITFVGGSEKAGYKLKANTGWHSGFGDDQYGFFAVPSGINQDGKFTGIGYMVSFWSQTGKDNTSAWCQEMSHTNEMCLKQSRPKHAGLSIRLVRDRK